MRSALESRDAGPRREDFGVGAAVPYRPALEPVPRRPGDRRVMDLATGEGEGHWGSRAMRPSTRRLLVWTSITMLLGQTGCAAHSVSGSSPTAAARERLEPSRTASAQDAEASRAGRGWATGARTCVKDFVSGKVFDPTVIAMLPLVVPVCVVIGALDIQAKQSPTGRATSEELALEARSASSVSRERIASPGAGAARP